MFMETGTRKKMIMHTKGDDHHMGNLRTITAKIPQLSW